MGVTLLERETAAAIPRPLPFAWFVRAGNYSNAFIRMDGLSVIVSVELCDDGRRWLHVSCARQHTLPDWSDIKAVKRAFIGDEKKAIQVLPPAAEYVNVHPHCLHLWHCLDNDGLPDFRRDGGL
jgi:hypothetical protein